MTNRRTAVRLTGSMVLVTMTVTVLLVAVPGRSGAATAVDSWQVVTNPERSPAHAVLNSVSCPSTSACVAVGSTGDGSPLIERSTNGIWSVDPTPTLPGRASAALSGVACPTTSFCIAVGGTPDLTAAQSTPVVEEWNGLAWSLVTGPVVSGVLDHVSCVDASTCLAVGADQQGNGSSELWDGARGTTEAGLGAVPRDISCAPNGHPDFCLAVYPDGGTAKWSGSWGNGPISPYNFSTLNLDAISCESLIDCLAVGSSTPTPQPDFPPQPSSGYIEQWSDQFFYVFKSAPVGNLTHVSCTTTPFCAAVGTGPFGTYFTEVNGYSWSYDVDPEPSVTINGISCASAGHCTAVGTSASGGAVVMSTPPPGASLEVAADGGIYTPGADADYFGSAGGLPLASPVVGITRDPHDGGYLEVASDGGIFSFAPPGTAPDFFGSMGHQHLNAPIVGITWDPHDGGYLEVASDGGIFSFAPPGRSPDFYGSMGNQHLNRPIVGISWDPHDNGYLEVASDGGIFSFAPPGTGADFYGSMGNQHLNRPIVGMTWDPHDHGYLEVASDGGIFSFAPPGTGPDCYGSMGDHIVNSPIVGIAWDAHDSGYDEVAGDGGLFLFTPAGVPPDFYGSAGSQALFSPIVGIMTTP